MPYIKKSKRAKYEEGIQKILESLKSLPVETVDGELSYVITKILKSLYAPDYFSYNRAMGVIESAKHEFYRRVVAPYEDKKLNENGDV